MEMNFGWVVPEKLAGSMGPVTVQDLMYLKQQGIGAVVRLEEHTISGEAAGLIDHAEFVPDFQPPTIEQTDRVLRFIQSQMERDVSVAVSCKAGVGRTGSILACYLISTGQTAEQAVNRVRELRPGSVESPAQLEFVHRYSRERGAPS